MKAPASGLAALLASATIVQGQPPAGLPVVSPSATSPPPVAGPPSASGVAKAGRSAPAGTGTVSEPPTPSDTAKPTAADADAEKRKPQKEYGWYTGGIYSFNLLNIEYYDLDTKDLHFSGQRRDIDSNWTGLSDLLTRSKAMGFVEINRKFVNLRNLSAIHDLGSGRGATLTFRDGATLKISAAELQRLIEVIR